MSTKFDKYTTDLFTDIVDEITGEVIGKYNYHPPRLDDFGRELVSDVSHVAVVDQRPVTLGERIRRYQRTPQFQHDLNNAEGWDSDDRSDDIPDELPDGDAPPPTPAQLKKLRAEVARKKREDETEAVKQADIEREKQEKAIFRKRMQELREEGAVASDPKEGGGA